MAIFQSPKNIFQRQKFAGKSPENSTERAIFAKFQVPNFENSEPEKKQFHTPSHSIPPLDSLLLRAPHMRMWGFEAKRTRIHPDFATNIPMEFHCHTFSGKKRKDTPPCSSEELFFAEKMGATEERFRWKIWFLGFHRVLYLPPAWKVFL